MVLGSICLEIYILIASLTGTRRVMGTLKGILWRLTDSPSRGWQRLFV